MKRGFAIFLCLALLAALTIPAAAEQQAKFLHPMEKTQGNTLYLAGAPLEGGTVTVTANGQSASCTVTTVQDAALPVTYYCMVDQSSSFSDSQKKQQKQALTALSDTLRPIDSMVLMLMGETVTYGDPLTTQEARQQAIEQACVYSARFTDLNASIVSVVERVAASQDNGSLSCILLITDGLDNAHVAVSQEQVFQSIQSSGLSFCTLSVVDPWAESFAQNNAARMEEYAAQSLGGVSVIPSRNYDSPTCVEDSVGEIVDKILSGSVMQLELDRLPATGNDVELEVTWTKEGTKVSEKRSLEASLIPAPTEAPQPETTEATQPETTEATQPETTEATVPETTQVIVPETTQMTIPRAAQAAEPSEPSGGSGNLILFLVLAGFVVVAVLAILAIVLWRKQRELEQQEEPEPEDFLPTPSFEEEKGDFPSLSELKKRLDFKSEPVPDVPIPDLKISPVKVDNTPGCRVRLVPENHPEGATEFTIGINESVTLGRNQRSDIVLNETDRALSSLHFELQWDSRTLYLRDRKSTNGTALNGVPLRPEVWVRVEKKAVIQAGSTRYTVVAEKK